MENLKDGILDDPQIQQLMKELILKKTVLTVENFLGNRKAQN